MTGECSEMDLCTKGILNEIGYAAFSHKTDKGQIYGKEPWLSALGAVSRQLTASLRLSSVKTATRHIEEELKENGELQESLTDPTVG